MMMIFKKKKKVKFTCVCVKEMAQTKQRKMKPNTKQRPKPNMQRRGIALLSVGLFIIAKDKVHTERAGKSSVIKKRVFFYNATTF